MKAISISSPGHMELIEAEKPEITLPDQVLVRIHTAGICGSDMHIYHGANPFASYPRIIGHEGSGEVVEVGSEVHDIRPGDKVVFEPIRYCGRCYACRTGHHNVCRHLEVLGVTESGTFREYAVVPHSQVYKYDSEALSYEEAALCEPYTIGAEAVWRGGVEEGDTVLVLGAGTIGLIILDTAKDKGARVIVSEPNEERLAIAREFGADLTVNPAKEDVDAFIADVTDGEGVNVVFEAAGVPQLIEHAVYQLSPAGRFVPMTYGADPIRINFQQINAKELTILGSRHQYKKFPLVVGKLPTKKEHIHRLITHIFPVQEYQKAFDTMADRSSGARKVLISFDS